MIKQPRKAVQEREKRLIFTVGFTGFSQWCVVLVVFRLRKNHCGERAWWRKAIQLLVPSKERGRKVRDEGAGD